MQKRQLGRVLGPLKNEGNENTQAVLTIRGTVVPRRTCHHLSTSEINSISEIEKRKKFDEAIFEINGDSMSLPKPTVKPEDSHLSDFYSSGDVDEDTTDIPEDDPVDATGQAVFENPFSDLLIHAKVLLPQGENAKSAKVKVRTKDINGDIIGTFDDNPLLNSILYDVEFPDGAVKQYAANTIAQNMYSQVDEDGYSIA